jgi:uncharacterized iron-regulated membrane protein
MSSIRVNRTRKLFALHSWLGLIGGGVLLIIGMAGSILVFSDEIDAMLNPAQMIGGTEQLSFDRVVPAVSRRYPDATITGLRLPKQSGTAPTVTMDRKGGLWFVEVDPRTGSIRSERNADRSFVRRVLALHRSFFFRPWGEAVVGVFALVLFFSALTGLIVYRKHLLRAFTPRIRWRGGARHLSSEFHRRVGVIAVLFQLLMSMTGFYMISPVYQKLLRANEKKPAPPAIDYGSISIDRMLAQAVTELPDFEPVSISLPREDGQPITVRGRILGESTLYGSAGSSVSFDPRSGEVRDIIDISQVPLAARIDKLVHGIHFGQYGALPVKIIYSLGGLTPGLMSVTGFILWRSRRRKRKSGVIRQVYPAAVAEPFEIG